MYDDVLTDDRATYWAQMVHYLVHPSVTPAWMVACVVSTQAVVVW